MPEVIGNKRAGPALRDGTVLCPQWNQGLCINGDACPKVQWVKGAWSERPHYTCPEATCQEERRRR